MGSDEYPLDESIKLNEGTANFGTNDIINFVLHMLNPMDIVMQMN